MGPFDLTQNPFFLLGICPRDGRLAIADTYEEALIEGRADEQKLLMAQQALMVSKSRLEAEISWLLDIAPSRVPSVINTLKKLPKGKKVKAIPDKIEGLARANLAAHLCANGYGSRQILKTLITCQTEYSVESVLTTVNANRSVSKFPQVEGELVDQALKSLQEKHRDAALKGIVLTKHPGRAMTELVEAFPESNDPARNFLEEIVERYDVWSTPKLREIKDEIDLAVKNLRSNPEDKSAIKAIVQELTTWDEYSQPRQLIYEAKGLDEPKSREICQSLRDLCVWLANEKGGYSAALRISKALLNTFSELPFVIDKVGEDIETLKNLVEEARAEGALDRLGAVAEEAMENIFTLLDSVLEGKFAPGKDGLGGRLYSEFDLAARKVEGSSHAALPWSIVISLAIELNNECQRADVALKILERVINYKGPMAPVGIQEQLKKDMITIKSNLFWEDINTSMRQGKLNKALKFLDRLIAMTGDAEKKSELLSTRFIIKKRINAQRRKWLIWGSIAAAVMIWIIAEESNNESSYTSPKPSSEYRASKPATSKSEYKSTQSTKPSITARKTKARRELRPASGRGHRLSRSEIRYCLCQEERLNVIRAMNLTDYEISRANDLVEDYNTRCTNFLYLPSDMSVIRSELVRDRQRLQQEAQQIVNSWRKESGVFLDPKNHTDALKIQMRLKELGYYKNRIDGIWGQGSRNALMAVKKDIGLSDTDEWDLATQFILFPETSR